MKLLLDFVIIREISTITELHHVQGSLKFINNEEFLDLTIFVLLDLFVTVFFLDLSLEVDIILEFIAFCIDLHQDHVQELQMHLEDLSILFNLIRVTVITRTLKSFQSQKTNLKLKCPPLKWQML